MAAAPFLLSFKQTTKQRHRLQGEAGGAAVFNRRVSYRQEEGEAGCQGVAAGRTTLRLQPDAFPQEPQPAAFSRCAARRAAISSHWRRALSPPSAHSFSSRDASVRPVSCALPLQQQQQHVRPLRQDRQPPLPLRSAASTRAVADRGSIHTILHLPYSTSYAPDAAMVPPFCRCIDRQDGAQVQ